MNIMLRQILCPVDFSSYSEHAMGYAAALAGKFGADLTLLHVVAPVVAAMPGEVAVQGMLQTSAEEISQACQERLNRMAGSLVDQGVQVACRVLYGVPYLEIIRFARESEIDLIVLGTHGRTGIAQLLIGSVAERVVRKAPCPVLTVKHPEHEFVMP
jgi:nucleotide-binding universal stress UspA family protein